MKHHLSHCLLAVILSGCPVAALADAALTIDDVVSTPTGALYANDENRITNLTYTVTLTNTGDVDLAPGAEGYSLTLVSYSPEVDLQTVDISVPIAAGESVTIPVEWDFSLDPIVALTTIDVSKWSRLDLRENVSNTKKNGSWRDIYVPSTSFNLVGATSNIEIDDPINFGFVTEPTTLNYRLRATGTRDVTVSSIDLPEGFSVSPQAPFTVTGLASAASSDECFLPIGITFNPTTPGAKAGVIRFNVDGADSKEYQLSGSFVGTDNFFESFDSPEGSDYVPQGWVIGDKWSISWKNTSDDDHYALSHSSADNASFAITPKLHFAANDAMTFEAAKRGSSSRLEVYYSADRSNWVLLKTLTPYGDEGEGTERFPASSDTFETYILSDIPEGDWYIGFNGSYCMINNVFGGERVAVEHDAMIMSSDFPAKATVNHTYSVSVTAKNLSTLTEAAGSYTVGLFANGDKVAEAEAPEWAAESELVFTMSYTPHAAGETELYALITVADIKLQTQPVAVTVSEETSGNVVTVGTATSLTNLYMPLRTNYNNSESQSIYTESFLAKFGITPGTNITGIAYDAKSSSAKAIPNTLTVWMMKVDESTISIDAPYDLTDVTPVFCQEGELNIIDSNSEPYELIDADFSTGFVYEGGNLLVAVRSEAEDFKSVDFWHDAELVSNTIYRYKDNHDQFLAASWETRTGVPVVKFTVYEEPAKMSGTVTDSNGTPVADTPVTLTSGDVIYGATTDAEGKYSIDVFQSGLTYTVTVDNESYPVYTDEVSFSGTVDGDITLGDFSSEREYSLTVNVTSSTTESLEGKQFTLICDRFSLTYPVSETKLDANGTATLNVYGGAHTITVAIPGMKTVTESFSVNKAKTIDIAIEEDVQKPFGASVDIDHDIFTGKNTATLQWNHAEVVFYDSFEDYDAFAISFAPWTGIDGDATAPVQMQGSYANAGTPCYAQIINPMAVVPVWDPVVYPQLTAKDGQQYAGFPQLANGQANNDWLITPAIELGEDNTLRFSIKSADAGKARFTVGITVADNPTAGDFTIISEGNYLEADYSEWQTIDIPLGDYAGQTVKIGFHCISSSGAFISQLDDVFVGRIATEQTAKARRVTPRSAANPNEKFVITLDGVEIGETTDYEYTIQNVQPGDHVVQIIATYLNAQAEPVELAFSIDADSFVATDFAVTTNNDVMPESMTIELTPEGSDVAYAIPVADGQASVASLPKGFYRLTLEQQYYQPYAADIEIASAGTVDVDLAETITAPFNVAHTEEATNDDGTKDVLLTWNRNYGFADSFEEYEDFATGSFGGWTTVNNNDEVSYPIGLGSQSNIVTFPGCSTNANPASVPPMVFNPHSTVPAMSEDAAILAPDGEKSVIFQGPQNATADKWLISPKLTIREGYEMSVMAKAYSIYPETIEFCISTTGNSASDFTLLDAVKPTETQWTLYSIPLAEYEGQDVYLAIHCTSFDGFIVQVDKFTVGREGGEEVSSAGYVKSFDVTHNGEASVNTVEPELLLTGLSGGTHTVGITANYASGVSEVTTYQFELDTHSGLIDAIDGSGLTVTGKYGAIAVSTGSEILVRVFNASGLQVAAETVGGSTEIPVTPGVYIVNADGTNCKVVVR